MTLLKRYLKPQVFKMALAMTIKFFGSLMDLWIPWLLSFILDSVIPKKSTKLILFYGSFMIVASLLSMVTNILANRLAARVSRDTTEKIRHDLFAKVSTLATSQFDQYGVASLVSRLTTDTYNIHQTIGMSQRIGIRAPILLLGGLGITFSLDPVLSGVLFLTLPFISGTAFFISKKGIPLFFTMQKNIEDLIRVVRENIKGAKVIKALSKIGYEEERFEKVNEATVKAETKASKTMVLSPTFMSLFLNIGLTMVILVSAFRVNNGQTTPGVIVAFLTYFTIILNAMMGITRIFMAFSRGLASANRIEEILCLPNLLTTDEKASETTNHYLAFQDVTFTYPDGTKGVENLSFTLEKGQTLGIIGETGSGKSTLTKLLLRFYDPQQGEIFVKGRNIRQFEKAAFYDLFGVALQKDVLFAESIEENIQMSRHFSKEEVKESLKKAQAASFVESLPEKEETVLNINGSNLSGGQRQRLLISRALLGNPEILILDDASSALDYQTDARLRQELKTLPQTTKIIIAQRISSIAQADKIIVMHLGKIVGIGSHEELLKNNETYREIYQFQGGV